MLRIGVDIGASQHEAGTQRLLHALSLLYPVEFVEPGPPALDGMLVAAGRTLPDVPALVVPAASSPSLHPVVRVSLAGSETLSRPLRGRVIEEGDGFVAGEPGPSGASEVLGSFEDEILWWREERTAYSRYPLARLGPEETLREHLRPGRFMGLLPLVHFLQSLLAERLDWEQPPLRASFVVDDPNLHWTSYGYLDYRELVSHAREHGYHLGLATVPLDGWRADRRASALLTANPGQVSLLMHGNDHVSRELGRLTATTAPPAIAQALRRVRALERRSGVPVERVMAPPHGACSREALQAMFALGLEGACISRPYPWLDGEPAPVPTAGFAPAELVAGGLPVLPRVPLSAPREDLALRALLGQPLILYGHHGDFREGLGVLAEAAADVNALGQARWQPLGAIARASTTVRRDGEALVVRMHTRLAEVEVPAGVGALRVEMPEPASGSACHAVGRTAGGSAGQAIGHTADGSAGHAAGALAESSRLAFGGGLGSTGQIALGDGETPGQIRLELLADHQLQGEDVPPPRRRLWPLLRRAAVEGRDRLQPLAGRS